MKLALLLPGLVPDLPWFLALGEADRVILDDCTPWSRKSRVHRYKIRTPMGIHWLGAPILRHAQEPLRSARIDRSGSWYREHLRAIQLNYRNSLYFDFLEAEIEARYEAIGQMDSLVEACDLMMRFWLRLLKLDITYEWASQCQAWDRDPDQLAENLGADSLILEEDSRPYQRQPVRIPQEKMPHPEYRQHFGGFYSGCGILDVVCSRGPEALRSPF